MPTTTTNYGFVKPDVGQKNWGGTLNATLDQLDTTLALYAGPTPTQVNAVTCTASPTFDHSLGVMQYMLLNQRVPTPSFTNKKAGPLVMILVQDGTGGREFIYPSGFKGATNITIADGLTAANTVCSQMFMYLPNISLYVAIAPLVYGE